MEANHTIDNAKNATPVVLDGQVIGRAGMHYSDLDDAFLRVMVNGVQVEDLDIESRPGFRAIVEVDLSRDLSQRKLIFALGTPSATWLSASSGIRAKAPSWSTTGSEAASSRSRTHHPH